MSQSALLTIFSSGAAAPVPFDPVSMFAGGLNGWLFNGAADQSDFLQSSGGSVAGDGDPLGYIEDLSGNANNIAQTTGGSKTVCNIAGGIRALKGTSAKYMDVTLADPIVGERTAAYAIRINSALVGVVYPLLMSVSGGYDFVYHSGGGVNSGTVGDNGAGVGNVTCADTGQTMFVVMKKINTAGTWTVQVSVYSASGTLIDEDTFASSGSSTITATQIGYPVANDTFWVPFHMCVEGVADTTDLLTYLVDQFGAWSPT